MTSNRPVLDIPHGDERRAKNRKRAVDREKATVERILEEEFSDLYYGNYEEKIPDEAVEKAFLHLCIGAKGHFQRIRHNHLVMFLERIAESKGLGLNNQNPILVASRESSPLTPKSFAQLHDVDRWVTAFHEALKKGDSPPKGIHPEKYSAGQLIFSLVWFSGVHNRTRLGEILRAIPNGVERFGDQTWMSGTKDNQTWRWLPDGVTHLLLQRWYRQYGATWPSGPNCDPEKLLYLFLTTVVSDGDRVHSPRRTMDSLMQAASTRSYTLLPGVLAHVQGRPGTTVSLPEESWTRLLTGKIPKVYEPGPQSLAVDNRTRIPGINPLSGLCRRDGLKGLDQIRSIIKKGSNRSKSGEKDKTYLSLIRLAECDDWPPIVRALSVWCAHMRRYGGQTKSSLARNTIKKYFDSISKPLTVHLSSIENLNELGEEDWEHIYEKSLADTVSIDQRGNRTLVLSWFHQFLVDQYAMPELHFEGVSISCTVDADILTPAEYVRSMGVLESAREPRRIKSIRKLVLMLGYRCGLRRSEVQKIQIRDLQGLYQPVLSRPELITRPNRFGQQKSPASTRRLPLWALLTEEEVDQLRDWLKVRLSEQITHQGDELLFCDRFVVMQPLTNRELFEPIQEAMRTASGTHSLRFHHLRHSCVTLNSLRLIERCSDDLFPTEWACDDEGQIAMPNWGRDIYAIANNCREYRPTRKRLWFLSMLAGHASPSQTLRSYSHLLDYAIAQYQRRSYDVELNRTSQAALMGVAAGSLDVIRNRYGLKGKTTGSQLASRCTNRWAAGVCRISGQQMQDYARPAIPEHWDGEDIQIPLSTLLVYKTFERINRLQELGNNFEAAVESAAHHAERNMDEIIKWNRRGLIITNSTTRRVTERDRWTMKPEKGRKQGAAYEPGKGGNPMPSLPQCPVPPKGYSTLPYTEEVFQRLRAWSAEDPIVFAETIDMMLKATSRGHSHYSFYRVRQKQLYLKFLEKAGLSHLTRVMVRPSEVESDYDRIIEHWSKRLGCPKNYIVIANESDPADTDRNPWGVAQVEMLPDKKLGKRAEQATMSVIRFVLAISAITFEGSLAIDKSLQAEDDEHPQFD